MTFRWLYIVIVILFITSPIYSQKSIREYFDTKGEIYFSIQVENKSSELPDLTRIISIENVKPDGTVFAFANEKEYTKLVGLGYIITLLPHPGDSDFGKIADTPEEMEDWDAYPTYDAYVTMMQNYAATYPDICEYIDAGATVQGRRILFLKISDNVSVREVEPQFMYSSSMHGNETTGYVLMLRLIDSLLTTYGINSRVTDLVDNTEIWINPLANPDGYVAGRRSNGNFVDLNRNFKDPWTGDHPDGNDWQPETIIMMDLAVANHFVMSANFHGGIEVVNYPWDGFTSNVRTHSDDDWFQFISHEYADHCQANSPPGYMTSFNDGITNGGDWYRIWGGRQDYFTYFGHGRETTVEISDAYGVPASQLPAHWIYNRESFLLYMEQTQYGIRGHVTFEGEKSTSSAKVEIIGHDQDHSEVYSEPATETYWRLIKSGTYSVTFSAENFVTQTFDNVIVNDYQVTILDVHMVSSVPVELTTFTADIKGDEVLLKWETATETNNKGFEIERILTSQSITGGVTPSGVEEWETRGFVEGAGTTTETQNYQFVDNMILEGNYSYRLKQIDYDGSFEYSDAVEISFIKSSPVDYKLSQNYPNPFNPTTTISYQIPKSDLVSLKVYNILGNEVEELINEKQIAGKYEVEFNAANLSSGVYIYKLSAGNFESSKKLVLIK